MSFQIQQEQLTTLLNLQRQPVGVRFLLTEQVYQACSTEVLSSRIPYCVMVKLAGKGRMFKAESEHFRCLSGGRALGILETDEFVASGQHFARHGLYDSLSTARAVQEKITFIDRPCYGIEIGPLASFNQAPDVVIAICTAYAGMRVMQGQAYKSGVHSHIQMAGNQGVCSECTAVPYVNNGLNFSMLCSGTRFLAKWSDDEIGFGIAYPRLDDLLTGLIETVNPTETNRNKKRIYAGLEQMHTEIEEKFGDNYFIRAFKRWEDGK